MLLTSFEKLFLFADDGLNSTPSDTPKLGILFTNRYFKPFHSFITAMLCSLSLYDVFTKTKSLEDRLSLLKSSLYLDKKEICSLQGTVHFCSSE